VTGSPWRPSWRADPAARVLADRHYNRQKHGAAQFVPPGRCLVMITADTSALWVTSWPYAQYVMHGWAGAWTCSLFRNEGDWLSSDLITRAVAHTRARWPAVPPLGIVTFVDAGKVRPKRHPGYCFLRAGWRHAGHTAAGLHVLQQLPDGMPPPAPLPGTPIPLFGDDWTEVA
jgi:hypothetical protein